MPGARRVKISDFGAPVGEPHSPPTGCCRHPCVLLHHSPCGLTVWYLCDRWGGETPAGRRCIIAESRQGYVNTEDPPHYGSSHAVATVLSSRRTVPPRPSTVGSAVPTHHTAEAWLCRDREPRPLAATGKHRFLPNSHSAGDQAKTAPPTTTVPTTTAPPPQPAKRARLARTPLQHEGLSHRGEARPSPTVRLPPLPLRVCSGGGGIVGWVCLLCFLRPGGLDDLKVSESRSGSRILAVGGGGDAVLPVDFVTLALARARACARGGATVWLRISLWGQWLRGQLPGVD